MAIGASSGARINNADGKIIIGTSVDMGGMNTGLKKISNSWKKLQYLTGGTLGVIGLAKFGKAALDAASDLQEVQNIVDVAFGDMKGKMETFADSAIEKFGMSELAAKQTGGSFMAMGKSMGLTMEQASDMAISLTGLTGDMASFYNISQDYARVALSAVYTGETETLKRYGIVLTEANLQEYASTQGITTKVKAMDSASKAMLRYQYILKATADMQGDFARTSGSWANQVRLLKEQWTVFLNVVGSGLITVLTPLLQMLNAIMAAIIRLARVIGSALVNIFGLKLQSVSDQFGAIKDAAGGAAEGVGGVGNAADKTAGSAKKANKELKTMLGSYDELHVISKEDKANAGGGGAGGGGGGGIGDFDIPAAASSMFDDLKDVFSDIDNMFDLGRMLSEKITTSLNNIPWADIKKKFNEFCRKIAEFLNGLITPEMFAAIGQTLAEALNTVIGGALTFGTTFDWENAGKSLAEGVNKFFRTFNFAQLADAIDAWVQGLYTALKTFIANVDWGAVLKGVWDFLKNLDLKTIEIIVGAIVLKKVGKWIFGGGAIELLKTTLMPILSRAFSLALNEIALGNGLRGAVSTFWGAIFGTGAEGIAAKILTALTGIVGVVGGLVLAVKNFFDMWQNGWDILQTIFEALGLALAAIGAVILGAPAAVAAAVAGIIFAISQIAIVVHDNWDAICEWASGVAEWWNTNVITPVAGFFTQLATDISTAISGAWDVIVGIWETAAAWFDINVGKPIGKVFQWMGQVMQSVWIIIKAIWIVMSSWFKENLVKPIKEAWNKLVTNLKAKIDDFKEKWDAVWQAISKWFNENIITPFKQWWDELMKGFKKAFDDFKKDVDSKIKKIKKIWNDMCTYLGSIWDGFVSGIQSAFKGAINFIIGVFEGFVNTVIDGLNFFTQGLQAVADVASSITGDDYSGIFTIEHVKLPRLAEGAVIPPNKEFAAILGDQNSGTNIEAPLSTIQDAVANVLEPYLAQIAANTEKTANKDLTVQIGDRDIARANQRGQRVMGLQLRTS